jgi:hypothetical protein
VSLRAAGRPVEEIAERIGLGRASTYRWLVRYDIPRRRISLRQDVSATPGRGTPSLTSVDLLALWETCGPDIHQLARHSGIRASAVRERLITAGVLPQSRPSNGYRRLDADDPLRRDLLERLYLGDRLVPAEIAERTGTTIDKVEYRLRAYRIPRRRPGTRPALDDLTAPLLRYLYVERGLPAKEIAELLRCSIPSVLQRLHMFGITVRRSRGQRGVLMR